VIVVADTTPLLYLPRINQLGLLRELYHQSIIPTTVWHEAVAARPDAVGVKAILDATWIVVSDQAERAGVDDSVEETLDSGEAAASLWPRCLEPAFYSSISARCRTVARERGLNVRGTLGVLVDGRRAGTSHHITSLRAALDELQAEGFRVAPALVSEALRHVGED
jgi:uncharacterized protein